MSRHFFYRVFLELNNLVNVSVAVAVAVVWWDLTSAFSLLGWPVDVCALSQGCANKHVPDFHVVAETASRPRLQCGLCTRLGEFNSLLLRILCFHFLWASVS